MKPVEYGIVVGKFEPDMFAVLGEVEIFYGTGIDQFHGIFHKLGVAKGLLRG